MLRSWKLGSVFGIGLYVHWSFLIPPLYVALTSWGERSPATVVVLMLLVFAVFGCVLLHELGHALMARVFGIRTRDITLYLIGGVAMLERMSEKPHEEIAIAVAGPAVNVVIAAILLPLSFVLFGVGALAGFGTPAEIAQAPVPQFLISLALCNIALVVFNMLPVFPMDGGRVLRALLQLGLGRLRATETAVAIGVFFAILLGITPFLAIAWGIVPNPMLLLVAAFVYFAGQMELAAVRQKELGRRRGVRGLPANHEVFDGPLPINIEPGFNGCTFDQKTRTFTLWQNGTPVGAFTVRAE